MAKGIELTKDNQIAPEIITDQVESLERLWNQILELIAVRRQELEENLEYWTTFVNQLEILMGKLSERESLLKEEEENLHVSSEEYAEKKIADYMVGLIRNVLSIALNCFIV